jgi:dolichol-phosphate mannosyltransferase
MVVRAAETGILKASASQTGRPHTLLTVVVPFFNEEEAIGETHRRLADSLAALSGLDYEIVYVDDGSADGTLPILRPLQADDTRVRVHALSRNFRHQIAVTPRLEHCLGVAVVVIDAHLRAPPEVIHDFVRAWRGGADVAYGLRSEREGETAFKLFTAKAFYRLINRLSDTPIPLDTGDFRLMDRRVADASMQMPERARFDRGTVSRTGFSEQAAPHRHAPRFAGETKYPLAKMTSFAADGILSFYCVPLRLATWTGFATAGLALPGVVYALVARLLTDDRVPGRALLFIALLFRRHGAARPGARRRPPVGRGRRRPAGPRRARDPVAAGDRRARIPPVRGAPARAVVRPLLLSDSRRHGRLRRPHAGGCSRPRRRGGGGAHRAARARPVRPAVGRFRPRAVCR